MPQFLSSKRFIHFLFFALCVYQIIFLWAYQNNIPTPPELIALAFRFEGIAWPTFAAIRFILGTLAKWLLILASAHALGQLLLKRVTLPNLLAVEKIPLAILLGLAASAMLIFALGVAHLYRPWVFWILTIAGFAGWLFLLNKTEFQEFGKFFHANFIKSNSKILLIFWAALTLLPLTMCFVPELFYDSLVYHIGLPHLYLLEGRYVDTPYVHFSRFPLLVHMLYVWALALDGEALAKLMHFSFLGLIPCLCLAIAKRLDAPRGGLLATLLCISIPVLQINIWTTGVDVALSTFALASLLCAIIWHQTEPQNMGALILSGIFAGATFGTKYTGAFFVFGCSGFIIASGISKRLSLKQTFQAFFVWGCCVTALMLPWFIRNAILTGNPFYPFLSSVFESRHLVIEKFKSEATTSLGYTPASIWGWLTLLWSIALRGTSNFDFFGPATMTCFPLLLAIPKIRKIHIPLITFLAVFFITALPFSRQIRYLLPGFCIMACLLGVATANAYNQPEAKKVWSKILLLFFIGAMVIHTAHNFFLVQRMYSPWKVLAGSESRKEYTGYYHPGLNPFPTPPIFDAISQLPKDARVAFLGEEKVFGCPRPYIYSNVYDQTPFVEWANAATTEEDIYRETRKLGITHLIVNIPEAMRIKGYGIFYWSPKGAQLFRKFWANHVRVVAIRSQEGAPGLMLCEIQALQQAQKIPELFPEVLAEALNLKTAYPN